MVKSLLLICLVFFGIRCFSQQDYFIYIQSEDRRPFYARITDKMYSSSESGYLIIPKLHDSTYYITVGFPKNVSPEQRFAIEINRTDKGFHLKNYGQKGWGLLDMQTSSVVMNVNTNTQSGNNYSGIRKTDAFTELLANVVNDSAILYTAVKPKATEQSVKQSAASVPEINKAAGDIASPPGPGTEISPTGTAAPVTSTDIQDNKPEIITKGSDVAKTDTLTKPPPAKPDVIVKASLEKPFIALVEEDNTEGMYMATYVEQYNFSTDTIRIFIPQNARLLVNPSSGKEKTTEIPSKQVTPVNDEVVKAATASPEPVTPKPSINIQNTDCRNYATDHDVDRLRVKLLSEKIMEDKLQTAKRYFRSKCFTVKQIKALSELFPTDETRYRFFDVAYPYISDSGNFYSLEELIETTYYKTRFNALIIK